MEIEITEQEFKLIDLVRSFQYGTMEIKTKEGKIVLTKEGDKIVNVVVQYSFKI